MESRHVFGEVLRELRRAHRLSQEKLAERSDCHRTYISLLERGEASPTLDLLIRLAEALGMTVTELVAAFEARFRAGVDSASGVARRQ